MSSVAAGARAAAPFLFGHLFAVGTRKGHAAFPFDVHMPFLLSIISLLAATLLVWTTPTTKAEASEMRRFASRVRPVTRDRWWRALVPARLRMASVVVGRAATSSTGSSASNAFKC